MWDLSEGEFHSTGELEPEPMLTIGFKLFWTTRGHRQALPSTTLQGVPVHSCVPPDSDRSYALQWYAKEKLISLSQPSQDVPKMGQSAQTFPHGTVIPRTPEDNSCHEYYLNSGS